MGFLGSVLVQGRQHIIYTAADHSDPTVRPNYDLYWMNIETKKITRITFAPGQDVLPVFSPDYKKVMWTSSRDGRSPTQLWIADFKAAEGACRLAGAQDVGRAARGRKADEDVARLAEAQYLARKHMLVSEVVPDRRHRGAVRRQCDCREGRPIEVEADHQFGRQMLRVRGASAIAGEQNLLARSQRQGDDFRRARHSIDEGAVGERRGEYVAGGFQIARDAGRVVHVRAYSAWRDGGLKPHVPEP